MSTESSPGLTAEALELMRRSVPLRIDEEGRWYHDGAPFRHERLAALFSAGLDLSPETGEAIVRVGERFCYIECVGTPFVVTQLDTRVASAIATLNNGDTRELKDATFVETEGRLALEWSDGRWARLSRGVYTRLADHLEVSEAGYEVVLNGERHPVKQG